MNTKQHLPKQKKAQQEIKDNARLKYFIHALDVKSDTNMTRVYSAMKSLSSQ